LALWVLGVECLALVALGGWLMGRFGPRIGEGWLSAVLVATIALIALCFLLIVGAITINALQDEKRVRMMYGAPPSEPRQGEAGAGSRSPG